MIRTAALGIAILVGACGHERSQAVGTTETTGYTPTAVQLYLAGSTTEGCTEDLRQNVHFAPRSDLISKTEMVDVLQWARCLNRDEMKDTTIVLTGGRDPDPEDPLFVRRALAVREALAERGVDPERILVGAPDAAREGGRVGPSNEVRLEISTSTTLKALR